MYVKGIFKEIKKREEMVPTIKYISGHRKSDKRRNVEEHLFLKICQSFG